MTDLGQYVRSLEAARDTLEDLVDRYSLDEVIEILSEVCMDKAEHLRSNWDDPVSARWWQDNSVYLTNVSSWLAQGARRKRPSARSVKSRG
jgi:N-methylhydantoinase B/oxoprolinase/acetone carboxylase alpha subunit